MPRYFLTLAAFLLATHSPVTWAHEQHSKDAARSAMSKHWQERLTAAVGSAVSVASDETGKLWLARMEKGHVLVSRSDDGGRSFVDEVKVNPQPEAVLADGQNRPKVVAGGGVVAVTWAQALPKLHSGNVRFSRSADGGKTFSTPQTVNDDREEIGHSFGNIALDSSGKMALVWLDGRERVAASKAGKPYRGSSVYYVLSDDRGATFAANRKLAGHSCECCRIGVAYTPEGLALAQWRHVFGDNIRDFAMAPLTPESKLSRVSEDNWQIAACPHHGGDLTVDESGRRHLVWFTGSPKAPGIFYRYADADRLSPPVPFGNADAQAGHPTVFARNGQVFLAWREYDGKQYRVLTQLSADRGQSWSVPREVAVAAGAADLPLFVAGARVPLLAWYAEGQVRVFNLGNAK